MHRVLSFQMSRGIDETSEYVTKRLCFSFLFSVGFFCLLFGFLLGRFAAERSMEAREQKTLLESAENGLQNTEHLQRLVLQELEKVSFDDRTIDWRTPSLVEAETRRVSRFFSNLSFINEVINHNSCVRATVRGSPESDRYVILSADGDGIAVALELARILDQIYSTHDWRPRRNLVFCVSPSSWNACPQTLSSFMRRKIMAYVALHDSYMQADDRVALCGSDVVRSIAVEAIRTISDDRNWTYLEHETTSIRFPLDIPHVSFSLNESDFMRNQINRNQSSRTHDIMLAQMVSQTVWRLLESIVVKWEPRYFNETTNKILKSINADEFQEALELRKTLKVLLAAVEDLNVKIDTTENTQMLRIRIRNDLLLDLDRALFCADKNSQSKTDLTMLYKLSRKSTNKTLNYLDGMMKCYEDAIQILQKK